MTQRYSRQLTDDSIDRFVDDLVDWLDNHPALFGDEDDEDWEVSDEGYDHLKDFVRQSLEPFSNGYKNHN